MVVIDDERGIREMLEVGLGQAGFEVRSAADGADGLTAIRTWNPDCIVLDVMLPKIDGFALMPLLRRLTEVPVIMLTARGDVRDRIDGLNAGADDYLSKPFDLDELTARIHTALRRPMLKHVQHLRLADLEIDLEARSVHRANRYIALSPREFDLLATLARRPKRVFTRDELLDRVWGADRDVSPAIIETYISYLRTKVDRQSDRPLIQTVRGIGYVLRDHCHADPVEA